eukprot:scaffold22162_cov28-Phaeocystis_antarctica.AAC.1
MQRQEEAAIPLACNCPACIAVSGEIAPGEIVAGAPAAAPSTAAPAGALAAAAATSLPPSRSATFACGARVVAAVSSGAQQRRAGSAAAAVGFALPLAGTEGEGAGAPPGVAAPLSPLSEEGSGSLHEESRRSRDSGSSAKSLGLSVLSSEISDISDPETAAALGVATAQLGGSFGTSAAPAAAAPAASAPASAAAVPEAEAGGAEA